MAPVIKSFEAVGHNAGRLAQAAKEFGVPVIATQQVKFGPIHEMVTQHHHDGVKIFEKATFSMLDD